MGAGVRRHADAGRMCAERRRSRILFLMSVFAFQLPHRFSCGNSPLPSCRLKLKQNDCRNEREIGHLRMSASDADSRPEQGRASDSTASALVSAAQRLDQDAWRELVDQYSWLIFQWCRNSGLSSQDAADITQNVLAEVAVYLPRFKKDGRRGAFRRWLRTITRSEVADFLRHDRKQPHAEGGSGAQQRILSAEAAVDPSGSTDPRVVELRDRMWKILDRIEDEFEDSTWQAFWLTVIENRTVAEVGTQLDLSPNAIRIAKCRVLQRLRKLADSTTDAAPDRLPKRD